MLGLSDSWLEELDLDDLLDIAEIRWPKEKTKETQRVEHY